VRTHTRPIAPPAQGPPPILQADLAGPIVACRSWVWTIGPAYAGVFLWIPLLDRLGTWIPSEPSLAQLAATAILAALACYVLLFLGPAVWGWKARQRLSVVAASTFGAGGSEWITGVALGLAAVLVYAVSLYMSIRLIFLGLLLCGLIPPVVLESWRFGPLVLQSPVTLVTCIFWIYITGMVSRLRMVSVIVGLMKVYTPVALLLLAATALLASSGLFTLGAARTSVAGVGTDLELAPAIAGGKAQIFQLIFGYFALSGLVGVDWGMAARYPRDIRIGGWISVILAGSYCTVVSLLTVAGVVGKLGGIPADPGDGLTIPFTFHWAVVHGIGGITGGLILMLFGVATLAPGCYAVGTAAQRFSAHWPRIRRKFWIWMTGLGAFVLIAMSWAGRFEEIFGLLGAVFAPAAGALVADALRQKGNWPGIRTGWNPPGVVAWAFGALAGLTPLLGALLDWPAALRFQPAALFAFLTGACLFLILSALGLERPLAGVPATASEPAHDHRQVPSGSGGPDAMS